MGRREAETNAVAEDEPPLDVSERLSAWGAGWRERHPREAESLRRIRRVLLWLAIPMLVVALIVVSGFSTTVPVTAGLLWLLLQVFWMARSKTVPWSLCTRVLLAGALLSPLVGGLEVLLGYTLGWEPGEQAPSVMLAGPVEETLKLAPLAAVLWLASNRGRRLGAADFMLLGLAAGAGFQLTEDSMRNVVNADEPLTGFAYPQYGAFDLLTGAQDFDGAHFAGHGVLSGLVAVGIGLALGWRRRLAGWIWALPFGLWALAVADHMVTNYYANGDVEEIARSGETVVELPGALLALHDLWGNGAEAAVLFAALGALAVVADYRAMAAQEHRLPALPATSTPAQWLGRWAGAGAARLVRAVPEDADPSFRRASGWVGTAIGVCAHAAARATDELTVLVGSAARGPRTWLTAMAWLRQRRELAAGLHRAAGRPRRRQPPEPQLHQHARALALALGTATTAVLLAFTLAAGDGGSGSTHSAFLAGLLDGIGEWWDGLSTPTKIIAGVGTAAVLGLAGMGFLPALGLVTTAAEIPEHGQGFAAFMRDPRTTTRNFIRDLPPGQALTYATGLALERVLPAGVGSPSGRAHAEEPGSTTRHAPCQFRRRADWEPEPGSVGYSLRRPGRPDPEPRAGPGLASTDRSPAGNVETPPVPTWIVERPVKALDCPPRRHGEPGPGLSGRR